MPDKDIGIYQQIIPFFFIQVSKAINLQRINSLLRAMQDLLVVWLRVMQQCVPVGERLRSAHMQGHRPRRWQHHQGSKGPGSHLNECTDVLRYYTLLPESYF